VQKVKRLAKFGIAVLLVVGLWAISQLGQAIFVRPDNLNTQFVPEDAAITLSLDGNKLLKEGFEGVILKAQDNTSIKLLLDRFRSKDGKGNLGVNFNSTIIYFLVEHNGHYLRGTLFNLIDPAAFSKTFGAKESNQYQGYATKDKVGLLLEDTKMSIEKEELNLLAEKILSSKSSEVDDNEGIIQISTTPDFLQGAYQASTNIAVDFEEEALTCLGDLSFAIPFNSHNYKKLKPEGLHLTTQMIPQIIHDSLAAFLRTTIPEIRSISVNYRRAEMIEQSGLAIVPDFDALIQFGDTIHFRRVVKELEAAGKISDLSTESFVYENRTFYYTSHTPELLYIGQHKPTHIQDGDSKELFRLNGELGALTQVDGNGIMHKLLGLLAIYSSGKEFTQSTEGIDLSIILNNPSSAKVSGRIMFDPKKAPSNEILRFLINGKLL